MAVEAELIIAAIEKVSELARVRMLSKAGIIADIIDAKKEENETKEVQISIGGFRFKTEKESIVHASFIASIKNNFDCSTDSAPVSLDPEFDFGENVQSTEHEEEIEEGEEPEGPATIEEDEHPLELPDADDERTEKKEESGEPSWGDDYEPV